VKTERLYEKIARLRQKMRELEQVKKQLQKQPDRQLSMTDPDARSMATSGRGSGIVGYNVQAAVDAKHHLIVEHEVTNVGNDHGQLSKMALSAKTGMGKTKLKVLADRGYFSGPEIRACDLNNISAYVPKPETRCHDHPPKYCRAWLGHAQALDGSCTLPDPDAWPREHGDEPSSTGLQPQAPHEYTKDEVVARSIPFLQSSRT
jgi:hypothetical protein